MSGRQDAGPRGGDDRLEALLAEATADIRSEVERLARSGEANLERLAQRLAETLLRELISGMATSDPSGAGGAQGSANQIAAAIARAAQKGLRFT